MKRGVVIFILLILLLGGGAAAAFIVISGGAENGGSPLPGLGSSKPSPTPEPPSVEIVTARFEIDANTVITDDTFLELTPILESELTEDMITNESEVLNMLALRTISPDQPVLRSYITEPGLSQQIPPADPEENVRPKAYPLLVNVLSGVADQLNPGDEVDIIITFNNINIRIATPSDYDFENDLIRYTVEQVPETASKTVVQRAQVLKVLRPDRPAGQEDEEDGEAPPPGEDIPQEGEPPPTDAEGRLVGDERTEPGQAETITAGSWVVVLAVTAQEAELIEFARIQPESRVTLVLRGAGDEQVEETVGATFDILVQDFGMPVPEPILPPAIVTFPQSSRIPGR